MRLGLVGLVGWCCVAAPVFADGVSLDVTASRREIYQGESFNLTVAVNGADRNVSEPDLSALTDATVQFLGSHSNSRSSIQIINGRMTREAFEGRVFSYSVQPKQVGTFRAGPIQVTANGKRYTHNGVAVRVTGVEQQDKVIVSLQASSTSVLVEEPFTITLSVAVQELPEPYSKNFEPLPPRDIPRLTADFLELRQPDPALKGPDLNQIFNSLIQAARANGGLPAFAINNYQTRNIDLSGFDSFFGSDDPFRPQPYRFRLEPKRITLNGKKYREYTLSLTYVPMKEGEQTFGPLTFKGPILTGVEQNHFTTQTIYTIGPAVTVRIVPPPDENRPDTFIGAVGKDMQASATFDTKVCKVGDPITLTLEGTGPVSVSNMRAPLLNLQPALVKDFRIYDDTVSSDTLPNGKRFKYRVRPMREGTLEFPPVELAYYDTSNRTYAAIATLPIPIQANATTQIATDDLGDDEASADSGGTLFAVETPKAPGMTFTPAGAFAESLLPSADRMGLLAAAGPVLCLGALLFFPLLRFARKCREAGRHSGALGRALGTLRGAPDAETALQAIRDYLGTRLDVQGQTLTPSEAERLLIGRGVASDSAVAFRQAFGQLEEALYRPDAASDLLAEAKDGLLASLPAIDRAISREERIQKRGGPSAEALGLAILLAAGLLRAAESDETHRFLWDQANAQAATASTPDAYLKAAETYNRLVAEGVGNGPLFLNLGNALVMAGDGLNAAAAYSRAERYMGATPDTRQGLAAALALQTGQSRVELPWSRTAFFWHYLFPCSVRVTAALCGWCLLWIGLFVRILLRGRSRQTLWRSLADTLLVTGALALVIFGASVAVTWTHERHDAATWSERTFHSQQP